MKLKNKKQENTSWKEIAKLNPTPFLSKMLGQSAAPSSKIIVAHGQTDDLAVIFAECRAMNVLVISWNCTFKKFLPHSWNPVKSYPLYKYRLAT